MSYTWFLIFSCSIFVAAIIGWVRFKNIAPAFHPFLYCIWIGSLNEMVSITARELRIQIDVNNNIYVLLEALLLLWQLRIWGGLGRLQRLFPTMLASVILIWIVENFILSTIYRTDSYFRLYYAVFIVILATHVNNRLIIAERGRLLHNPVFLACSGLIIYFTFKMLVEICWLYGLEFSDGYLVNVYSILIWINLIANLIYSFAILWMPAKQRFMLPY